MQFDLIFLPSTRFGEPERYDEMFELAQAADELGYNCLWFTEHHFEEYGRPSPILQAMHAADVTKNVKLGIAVVVLPFHHPIHVAEDIATLDQLSHGRVQLGIGRGQQPGEFAGHGIAFNEVRARFNEAFEIIMGLWQNESFSYQGKFWQIPEVRLNPKPYQKPHPPLWQPAVSPDTVPMLIDKGINGLVGPYLMPYQQLKEKYFEPWHRHIAETGRRDLTLAHNEVVYVAETDEQARSEAREAVLWYVRKASQVWGARDPHTGQVVEEYAYIAPVLDFFERVSFDEIYDELSLIGSPERVTERLKFFDECGVQTLCLFQCDSTYLSQRNKLKSIELFAKRVMPHFQKQSVAA